VSDLENDFETWMGGDDPSPTLVDGQYVTTGPEDWRDGRPDSDTAADRLARRIRRAETELARIAALADEEVRRARAWQEDRSAGPRRLIAEAEKALEGWARWRHAETQEVTWKLPHATVKLLAQSTSLIVDDEEAAIASLLAIDPDSGYVKVERTVRRGDLKAAVDIMPMSDDETAGADPGKEHLRVVLDGEIIPGLHAEKPAQRPFKQGPPGGTG